MTPSAPNSTAPPPDASPDALAARLDCPASMRPHILKVLQGEYDIPNLHLPGTSPVILDIGANVGAFALWALHRWPLARITCYEPHPDNFALLQKNLPRGPTLVPVAVWHSHGQMFLHDGLFNCGEASLVDVGGSAPSGQLVPVIAASSLPRCDILKIDTEGAELPILQSYPHLPRATAIMLEWHSPADRAAIAGILQHAGFTCIADDAETINRGVQKWVSQKTANV